MVIVATNSNNIVSDESSSDSVAWWESTFLEELARYCNVSSACRKCKKPDGRSISRSVVYDHYNKNPRFKALWDEAIAESTDKLRETALKLANGEFKMKNAEGLEYTLPPNPPVLLRLLEAHDPNYRAVSRQEVTGANGGAIETRNLTPEGVTQADVDRLIEDYVKRRSAEIAKQP